MLYMFLGNHPWNCSMTHMGDRAMHQEMEYIFEVYKEKNFTRAAEKLYITQPALSMAIQKVEERLGVPVFDRSTRPLSLTDAGEAYIRHILHVKQLETELNQKIQDIRELNTGALRIGGSHYLNAYILPPVLAAFAQKYPRIEINLVEASSAELAEQLRQQEIDLTFHCSPEFIQDFERYPAFCDNILLAAPKDLDCCSVPSAVLSATQVMSGRHLEKDCPSVPLAQFQKVPFILLTKGNNLYERSVRMFEEAGFAPVTRMRLSQLVTACHLAGAGIGATFVSDRLISAHMTDLNYYRIDSELTARQFYILLPKRKYVSAAVHRFIESFQLNDLPDKRRCTTS